MDGEEICPDTGAGPSRLSASSLGPIGLWPLGNSRGPRPCPSLPQVLEQVSSHEASAQTPSLGPGLSQWPWSAGDLGASLGPQPLCSLLRDPTSTQLRPPPPSPNLSAGFGSQGSSKLALRASLLRLWAWTLLWPRPVPPGPLQPEHCAAGVDLTPSVPPR